MFAVQITKALKAEVSAVCSAWNLEMACSMGADHVTDYRKEDFTQNGKQYDLILAVNGYHPISDYLRAAQPGNSNSHRHGTIRLQITAAQRKRTP